MNDKLRVQLAEDGADAERLDALTGFLREELLQLEVDDVTALRAGPPPSGARAIDAVAIGGLLVSLGGSADALRKVISTIKSWLARGDGVRRTIRVELAGDALELSEATAADQDRLITLFINRHISRDG